MIGQHKSSNWRLGTNFLRGYYSIWDAANSQIGFAPKVGGVIQTIASSSGDTGTILTK